MAVLAIDTHLVRVFQLVGNVGKRAAEPLASRSRQQTICHPSPRFRKTD